MNLKNMIALGMWIFAASAAERTQAPNGIDKTVVNGCVVACRWVDFISQFASSVENEEQYLFETTGARPTVIKVIYRHYGYTTLTDKLLSGRPILSLQVRRDRTCDETYGSYVKNAEMLADPIAGGMSRKVTPVQFYAKTEETEKLSSENLLDCFVMEQWDFTIIRKTQ